MHFQNQMRFKEAEKWQNQYILMQASNKKQIFKKIKVDQGRLLGKTILRKGFKEITDSAELP